MLAPSLSRPPPVKIAPQSAILDNRVIAMAIVAATEAMRISRLPTWLIS